MKQDHSMWMRLVDAARTAPPARATTMPYGFDTRVLAAWRAGTGDEESWAWGALLRWAMLCSALVMILSLLVSYPVLHQPEPTSLAIANSALRLSLAP